MSSGIQYIGLNTIYCVPDYILAFDGARWSAGIGTRPPTKSGLIALLYKTTESHILQIDGDVVNVLLHVGDITTKYPSREGVNNGKITKAMGRKEWFLIYGWIGKGIIISWYNWTPDDAWGRVLKIRKMSKKCGYDIINISTSRFGINMASNTSAVG